MKIRKNINLSAYTSFNIGGYAKFFSEAASEKELLDAVKYAIENELNYFILGGGTNILIADEGYDGLVIKINNNNINIDGQVVNVDAGVLLSDLINKSIENSLAGLENFALIPGSVGGAIYGNAGSFGKSISDFIEKVIIFDKSQEQVKEICNDECEFGYRDSIFKRTDKFIILSAKLRLKKDELKKIKQRFEENNAYKRDNLEWQPSAGCVFKNIDIKKLSKRKIIELERKGLDLEQAKKNSKIAAAYMIDMLNLKGKQVGGAKVSDIHANFIINTGTATANDVIMLESLIKQKIRDKYNLQLELEQILIGF